MAIYSCGCDIDLDYYKFIKCDTHKMLSNGHLSMMIEKQIFDGFSYDANTGKDKYFGEINDKVTKVNV